MLYTGRFLSRERPFFIHYMKLGVILGLVAGIIGIVQAIPSHRDSKDLLPEHTFTAGMEGPATDKQGIVYAVNYEKEGTIGYVRPDGTHGIYVTLPEGSVGNGIRFDSKGNMYIADYTQHNILKIDSGTGALSVLAHEPRMNQPNDIAIAPNGTIYASDPNWADLTGQLWMISTEGEVTCLEENMGTTNGIEVSPDGKHLYVGESAQRRVWVYDIAPDGTLTNKHLFKTFLDIDYGLDGMRCDKKGNIYLARYDKGTILILDDQGNELREIKLKGKKPSNLTFGGKDRKRVFVTMADRGCFEYFEADYPGRE